MGGGIVVGRAEFAWNVKSGYTSEWFSCDVYSRYHFLDSRNGYSSVTIFVFSSHSFGEVAAIQKFQRALYYGAASVG